MITCYGIGERTHTNDTVLIRRSHASYAAQLWLTVFSGFMWSHAWSSPLTIETFIGEDVNDNNIDQSERTLFCQYQYTAFTSSLGWIALTFPLLVVIQQLCRPRTLSTRANTLYALLSLSGLSSYLFANLFFDTFFGRHYDALCGGRPLTIFTTVVHILFNAVLLLIEVVLIAYYMVVVRNDTVINGEVEGSDVETTATHYLSEFSD